MEFAGWGTFVMGYQGGHALVSRESRYQMQETHTNMIITLYLYFSKITIKLIINF